MMSSKLNETCVMTFDVGDLIVINPAQDGDLYYSAVFSGYSSIANSSMYNVHPDLLGDGGTTNLDFEDACKKIFLVISKPIEHDGTIYVPVLSSNGKRCFACMSFLWDVVSKYEGG